MSSGRPLAKSSLGRARGGKRRVSVHWTIVMPTIDAGRTASRTLAAIDEGRRAAAREAPREGQQRHARRQRESREVRERGRPRDRAAHALEPARAIPESVLELAAPSVDQVVADVTAARVGSLLARELDGELRDVLLGGARGPGQVLDRLPVRIAGVEVHAPVDVGRVPAQDGFDAVRLLEERLPVDLREQPQAADRPLHADGGAEPQRPCVGGDAMAGCAVEETVNGHAQLFEKEKEPVEHRIAEHGRQRPDLGDGERRHLLVRVDEGLQGRDVDLDAAPDHESARERVDAGHAPGGPARELRASAGRSSAEDPG